MQSNRKTAKIEKCVLNHLLFWTEIENDIII